MKMKIGLSLLLCLLCSWPVVATNNEAITIGAAGDVMFAGKVEAALAKKSIDEPFKQVKTLLSQPDYMMVNLETSVTTRGAAEAKEYTFRSQPKYLQGMKRAGIDFVTVANNHAMDYGKVALEDTMRYAKAAGLTYGGAGWNEKEAYAPQFVTIKGKKVAILAGTRVVPTPKWYATKTGTGMAQFYTTEPFMTAVKAAVKQSDYTVLYVHWNDEYNDYPSDYAKKLARQWIDAGVDAIVGSHSHCLMGVEYYKGKPIVYSLGNFVFTMNDKPKAKESMVALMTFNGNRVDLQLKPLVRPLYFPQLPTKAQEASLLKKLRSLSVNATIDSKGNVVPKIY